MAANPLKDLPGVGEKTAEKLVEAGYEDMMAIAAASIGEICDAIDCGEGTAEKIIDGARHAVKMDFETAETVYEKRKLVRRITTGSPKLDALQLPEEKGGLGGGCVFIDTENTFRPERVEMMAKGVGLDPQEVLKNIYVARAYNSDHQLLLVEKAKELLKDKNVKLLIIDSLTSLFRSDYSGRGELAPRQQKLNRHLHNIQKISEVSNLAVYITNQVMSNPGQLFGDPTTPAGGHVLAHAATYRLYMRRSREDKRVAKLIDSPSMPDAEVIFRVTDEGIRD